MLPARFAAQPTLEGRWVRLVPLEASHAPGLRAAAHDADALRFMLYQPGTSLEEMRQFIAMQLEAKAAGTEMPFTTVLRSTGALVGNTRYLEIDRLNHSVEVGGTWLDTRFWNTPVNTEAKYLMFRHAFEVEGVHRVWLRTDVRNERSRRAILRTGAIEEAVFREHLLLANGLWRSSVVFGIVRSEWANVKAGLEAKLARSWNGEGRDPVRSAVGPGEAAVRL